MKTTRGLLGIARLGLLRLENRIAPAAGNSLVSLADPLLPSDSGGGVSGIVLSDGSSSVRPTRNAQSADGRFVVFTSTAANLTAGQIDGNAANDVFVYDRQANTTALISHAAGLSLQAGNAGSSEPVISGDGRFVAFASASTNLIAGMTMPSTGVYSNIFLYDRLAGTSQLVSHRFDSMTTGGSYDGSLAVISADGGTVAFKSRSVDLIPGFPNPGGQIYSQYTHTYAFSRITGFVTLIDHDASSNGTPSVGGAEPNAISANGRYIVFSSGAQNIVTGVTEPGYNIFRFDQTTGQNSLVTKGVGAGANDSCDIPMVSDDGQRIVFVSPSTNLITGSTITGRQVYLYDAFTDSVSLVSHVAGNSLVGGSSISNSPAMCGDGRYVAYASQATDLLVGFMDGNGSTGYDVFLYDSVTNQTTLVSRQNGSTIVSGNGSARQFWIDISGDGSAVIFTGAATDLVPGFIDRNGAANNDLYRFDRSSAVTTLVSGKNGSATEGGNQNSTTGYANADGKVIAWTSMASDLVAGTNDGNGSNDVFIRDTTAGTTVLASRRFGSASLSPGGASEWMQQSADGRYVVFTSTASNVVPGQVDGLGTLDVFLFDRSTNTTALVSHAVGNVSQAANNLSGIPVISRDGRYVAYVSHASDLVAGFVDGNGPPPPNPTYQNEPLEKNTDVFLYDRVTGTTQLVSHQVGNVTTGGNKTSGTLVTNAPQNFLGVSDDGRQVTFTSQATDLVSGFVNNIPALATPTNIFVFDRVTTANTLVSQQAGSPASSGNSTSQSPSISGDGRYVAYSSLATNVITGGTLGSTYNIFLFDRQLGSTSVVSHPPGFPLGGAGDWCQFPSVSRDGNFVLYQSYASNMVGGMSDGNAFTDIFLYNRLTDVTVLVSHTFGSQTTAGNQGVQLYKLPTYANGVSDDGRFVAYASGSTNVVSGFIDGNGNAGHPFGADIYLYDRLTGTNSLVSRSTSSALTGGNGGSFIPIITGNGRFVVFISTATDLIPGYSRGVNSSYDVFSYDRLTDKLTLLSHDVNATNVGTNTGQIVGLAAGFDGAAITYVADADNLAAGDFNSFRDVFAYVTPPPQVTSIKINDGNVQRSTVRSITINFDQPVFFSGDPTAAFTLSRDGSAGTVQLAVSSYTNSPNGSISFTFSGSLTENTSLIDGRYSLSIIASMVSNIAALDGNGDGTPGDNYLLVGTPANGLFRLFGDGNGDGAVSGSDFNVFRTAFGGSSAMFDFDNDGSVSVNDFNQFKERFGASV